MTAGAWFRLFALSIAVNVLVVVAPIAFLMSAIPGGGVFVFLFGVPFGAAIAIGPALATVVLAIIFARLRSHFSFLQFAVIGTLVSCAFAGRNIASGNDMLLDYLFYLLPLLPFAWCVGWLVAYMLGVLPSPMPAGDVAPNRGAAVWTGVISAVLIVVPVAALSDFASHSMDTREQVRAAERRGNCPDGLECAVYSKDTKKPDPAVYVANLDGQRFVLPANSLAYPIHNQEGGPGDLGVILLTGLLPTFEPRSDGNIRGFGFPYEDVATAEIKPVCYPSGYCLSVPFALAPKGGQSEGLEPIYVSSGEPFAAPPGLAYLGDIYSVNAQNTTGENADSHVYGNASRAEFIICRMASTVPKPSCSHTFVWETFRLEVSYRQKWLAHWTEIKTNLIAQLNAAANVETLPEGVIHIVDPLP